MILIGLCVIGYPKEKDKKIIKEVRETFKNSNGKIFRMFELALKQFKYFMLQIQMKEVFYITTPNERRKHWFYDYEPKDIKSNILYTRRND